MMRFYPGFYPRFDPKRYEALKDIFISGGRKAAHPAAEARGCRSSPPSWLSRAAGPICWCGRAVDGLDPVMRRQVWEPAHVRRGRVRTTVLVSSTTCGSWRTCANHVGILSHGRVLV